MRCSTHGTEIFREPVRDGGEHVQSVPGERSPASVREPRKGVVESARVRLIEAFDAVIPEPGFDAGRDERGFRT